MLDENAFTSACVTTARAVQVTLPLLLSALVNADLLTADGVVSPDVLATPEATARVATLLQLRTCIYALSDVANALQTPVLPEP